ncbi:MAG: type II CAAX endopeptidase family protein [Verrucomicrobiota bacterium]|nr:type II CAAX endopeptidase family protein [Verrucomicrobiota bacterium]
MPWTPADVLQILLTWILVVLLGQLAFAVLMPHGPIGPEQIEIDGNKTTLTFFEGGTYEAAGGKGKFRWEQARNQLILEPNAGDPITVKFHGTLRDRIGILLTNLVCLQCSMVALVFLLLRKTKSHWRAAFGPIGRPAFQLWLGPALFGMGFVLPAFGLHYISQTVLAQLGHEPVVQEAVQMVMATEHPVEVGLQVVSVVIMAPIAEELLFRGILYNTIKHTGYPIAGMIISAALFALVHGSLALMLPLFVMGFALAWVYEKSGSIIAPMMMHATFNAINFSLLKLAPIFTEKAG